MRVTKLAVVCTVAVGALLCYGAIFGVNIFSLRSPGGTCPFFLGGGGVAPCFPPKFRQCLVIFVFSKYLY